MFAASKTASVSGGYQIQRSLRFNSADSAYLNRTPASASNQKTWTFSAWVKRAAISTTEVTVFGKADTYISINSNSLTVNFANGGANYFMQATAVLRDPSAWYHIIIVLDTTQATAANRASMYVNGVQTTAFQLSTYTNMAQNYDAAVNSAAAHAIGRYSGASPSAYFDGYMTEVNFIDGQALTPSSFGETNAQTGVWQPKAYSGSYGTNGFYLNFSDNSNTTAATLGKDYSGNGNNWTPNNFSVTAGAGNDSLVDSPTSYGTDTGVGGTVRGNYTTNNPLELGSVTTLANGNLDVSMTGASGTSANVAFGTISVTSGKWYWEVTPTTATNGMIGVSDANTAASTRQWQGANFWGYYSGNGNKYNNNSGTAYGSSYTTNDVIGVALDMDAGTVTFYKNGTSQGTAFSSFSGKTMQPALNNAGASTMTYTTNFGQRPFAYTAPSGYKALCTQNLPTPTIGATSTTLATQYFTPVTYTGTGATRTVTGVNFAPDLVWIKSRSAAYNNRLYDKVRGVENVIQSNSTAAEASDGTGLTAFGSDGFTLGSSVSQNESGSTFVSWNWKANGSGSTNTAGSITSTVSANTTSGFSVVTYTGTGASASVGHGLGALPQMIIVKRRNSTADWAVYHRTLGANTYLFLNSTAASASVSNYWQYTTSPGNPTSDWFGIIGGYEVNVSSATYVAYCFAEVAGYSKFGSWTGNGSADGPFVFTGFRPAYVLYKGSSAAGGAWDIHDAARSPRNVAVQTLFANTSGAEGGIEIDILSNGFKIRDTSANANSSGATYIFAAFAESPQKFSLAR